MPERDAAPYWIVALLALGYAVHIGGGGAHPIGFVFLAVSIVALAAATAFPTAPRLPVRTRTLLTFGVAAHLALAFVFPVDQFVQDATQSLWLYRVGTVAALILSLWALRATDTAAWLRVLPVALVFAAQGVWVIAHSPEPLIDVWHFQQEGTEALLAGVNPYEPIYEDVYGGDSGFYGPGIVEDGRLTVGLPYPPLSLLLAAPAKLIAGDHRYAQLLAVAMAAVAMAAVRPGQSATGAALLLLSWPRTHLVVERGWTEPFAILLLALVALSAVRAPRLLGFTLGLLIAVKQFMLIALPLATVALARLTHGRLRLGGMAIATAAAVTVPFVLWNPAAFYRSTVEFLILQPFRPDTLTFLGLLPGDLSSIGTLLGFAGLGIAGVLVAARLPRTPAAFTAGLAWLLLAFFAFGKQGAMNYYFLVMGALTVAIASVSLRPASSEGPR